MDNNIYTNNVNALQNRFPGLAEVVSKKIYNRDQDLKVQVETAFDGNQILIVNKDNRTLYIEGKREPQKKAQRVIERWEKLNNATTIVVIGMGNVTFIKELLRRTPKQINIMVYEPSVEIFLTLLEKVDITEYFNNRALGLIINGINENEAEPVIKAFINISNLEFIKNYRSHNYQEFFGTQILDFLKRLDRIITEIIVNVNTGIAFSKVESNNIFHNIEHVCNGYVTTQLCDVIPIDIPAIIVSAGPSLNKNINGLKKAKNRAFIVAVDTALKPLVKAGIIPDLYVIVDGKKPEILFDFEEAKTIPLMTSISAPYKILKDHKGKKIFFNEGNTIVNHLFAMNGKLLYSVACGGSVACSAFSLVYKMGFSKIILVGQDLALTGNKTHADGTFQEKMDIVDTSHSVMVEGNYEKLVPTRADYKVYLDWFNYYIAGCRDVHVINATEGGAKIQNTEVMTLQAAIERECSKTVDMDACFSKLKPALNETERLKAVEYLNTIPSMFSHLRKYVDKGISYYEQLQKICSNKKIDQRAYLSNLNKIKKITKKIEEHELFGMISDTLAIADYMVMSEQYYEEDSLQAEGLEIANKGIQYMKLVDKCIDLFIPLAEETVGKIK